MEIVSIVTAVIGEKLKSLFERLTDEFGSEINQIVSNKILEYQVEEYNRNYSTKTLLHRVQPKKLKDFYQPLHITPLGTRQSGTFKRIPTSSISEMFGKKQFVTLIGNAGSGKSTIVKYLFLNSIDSKFKIPIKVELRYLNDHKGSVIDFIKKKIFKFNKLATSDRIIERLMSSGDFVFFLDGYDEINSTKKEKITKEIDDLVKLYNKNYYLLTTRPYTEVDLLPMFYNYEVCELSDADINSFISKQIPDEESELCNKIIEAVNSKENVSYKSFLSNPLLLSMFILTFQSYSSIPQKRSEFYSQVFDALFSVHDSMSKLAFVREKQSGLSKEQIVDVLKLFSFLSYFDEQFIFSGVYIEEKFRFIKKKKRNLDFDNQKLISDLQVAVGILNKEGTDYTFPHRSLQEYFAAIYIFSLNDENKKIVYKKIMESIVDKKSYRQTSRGNFYLLLSELDERNVIKYALIPYFQKFITRYNSNEKRSDVIIDQFSEILSVYTAFSYILDSSDVDRGNVQFNREYGACIKKERGDKEQPQKNDVTVQDLCRKKVILESVHPFMKSFVKKMEVKKRELNEILTNDSNSDSEIVSLI